MPQFAVSRWISANPRAIRSAWWSRVLPKLTIVELRTTDVFQDMVRVHQTHRRDVPAGRICRVTRGSNSVLLVARGAPHSQPKSFAVDLRTRNRLGIASYGQQVEVYFERATWLDEIIWGWRASEPISRIATRLGVISLGLGILGAVLGAISLFK